ncbi:hypothetical protein [Dokdonella sp.]|uniref:hypothetical protein n=1 Tax=Dokdonella sp. TaxID=2291710 RepID=UPI0031C56F3B|nr:hypothetical protein [Dokdonella sp.]
MRRFRFGPSWRLVAGALLLLLLAACGGGGAVKPDATQAANIPTSFDVTLLADKDGQFDFDGAPLTTEDLKSAFRYRLEEKLPMSTVLLRRGEKQKVRKQHLSALARIAMEMNFKAYVLESNGQIAELQAR